MKITATIPTGQYANIQPEIEGNTVDECMEQIKMLFERYGTAPLVDNKEKLVARVAANTELKKVTCVLSGKTALFDEKRHIYYNEKGEKMLSGSAFASKYVKPFDIENIAPAYAKKNGLEVEDVIELWESKGSVSAGYGTALHKALEIYGRFRGKLPDDKILCGNQNIQEAVIKFYELQHDYKKLTHEAFVMNGNMCGIIDLLATYADGSISILDFKTNAELKESRNKMLDPFSHMTESDTNKYLLQLSFYAEIAKRNGYKVNSVVIYHYDGLDWEPHTYDPINITAAL